MAHRGKLSLSATIRKPLNPCCNQQTILTWAYVREHGRPRSRSTLKVAHSDTRRYQPAESDGFRLPSDPAQDVVEVDDAAAQSQQHQLDPVAAAGLGQQVAHVGLDRGHGQPLPVADLLVGQAQGDERQDLALALGQGGDLLRGLRRPDRLDRVLGGVASGAGVIAEGAADLAGAHGGEQPARGPRGDDGVAVVDGADRGDEVLGRGVLEQETGRTGLDGAHDVAVGVEGGQDDDPPGDAAGHELAGGGQTVEPRHLHVEQENVDRVGGVTHEGVVAVDSPPDDLHIRLRPQQHGQPHGEQRLVIGQTQADHRRLPFLTSTHRKYPLSGFSLWGFVSTKCRRRHARFAIPDRLILTLGRRGALPSPAIRPRGWARRRRSRRGRRPGRACR